MNRNRIFPCKSHSKKSVEEDDDDDCSLEVVDINYGKFFGKSKPTRPRPLTSSAKQK